MDSTSEDGVFSVSGDHDIEQSTDVSTSDETTVSPEGNAARTLLQAFHQQDELHFDESDKRFIYRLLHGQGHALYGIGAFAIYIWKKPCLVPVGFMIKPEILSNVPSNERTLVSHAVDAYPNVDLVGALWSTRTAPSHSKQSDQNRRRPAAEDSKTKSRNGLHWRELSQVIDDPDQSSSQRTVAMRNAGLEKATGIKFCIFGIRGMAVYYAEFGVDQSILKNPAYETYLCRVAYLKASLLSVIAARRDVMRILPESDSDSIHPHDVAETTLTAPSVVAQELRSDFRRDKLRKNVVAWLKKTYGAGAQIPPCFSWTESIWTAVGTFMGAILIGLLNTAFKMASNEVHYLELGPFGALLLLQYGLIGAPAGQPRTVLGGHIIAGALALGLTYIPESQLPTWARQILAVTLANFFMVKVGVPCPPASAHSLIYADGKHDFKFWALALLSCVVSFIPAIFFNNLNPTRQYPSFWGYAPQRVYQHLIEKTKKDTEKVTHATKVTTKGTVDTVKRVTTGTEHVATETEKDATKTGVEAAQKVKQVVTAKGKQTASEVNRALQIPTGSSK